MYDLGSRLKSIRLQRGLTQRELAARVNKSVSAISSYESNAQLPPLDVLESIVLTLNVSLDYLVGIEQYNTYSTQNLTASQKNVLEMLFKEFHNNTPGSSELTEHQVHILQKLVLEFVK